MPVDDRIHIRKEGDQVIVLSQISLLITGDSRGRCQQAIDGICEGTGLRKFESANRW